LWIAAGNTWYITADRFQCSTQTVNKYFHLVLNALLKAAKIWIVPPKEGVPSEIQGNPKFHPYFSNCKVVSCIMDLEIVPIIMSSTYRSRYLARGTPKFSRKNASIGNELFESQFYNEVCYFLIPYIGGLF
jgi:hypothetical protein